MAKTYEELLEQAAIIRDETAAGKNTATRVGGTITDAVDYVKELQDTYKGIHAEAAEAKTTAAAAKTTAEQANRSATNAFDNARSAQLTANAASGTANEAKTEAAAAKTTAEQANRSATNAFDNARSAQLTANAASGTANEAKAKAEAAQEAANTAQQTADAAQTKNAEQDKRLANAEAQNTKQNERLLNYVYPKIYQLNEGAGALPFDGEYSGSAVVLDGRKTAAEEGYTYKVVFALGKFLLQEISPGGVTVGLYEEWDKIISGRGSSEDYTRRDCLYYIYVSGGGSTYYYIDSNGKATEQSATYLLRRLIDKNAADISANTEKISGVESTANDAKSAAETAQTKNAEQDKRLANAEAQNTKQNERLLNYVYPKIYQLNEGAGALPFDGEYSGSAVVLDGRKTAAEEGYTYKVVFALGKFLLQEISPGGVTVGLYEEWDKIISGRGSSEDYTRRDCLYYVYTEGEGSYYYYVDEDGKISEQAGTYLLRRLIDETKAKIASVESTANSAQAAASAAQATATAANSTAETAQTAADTAQETANSARETATAASTAAQEAKNDAETAQSAATAAQTKNTEQDARLDNIEARIDPDIAGRVWNEDNGTPKAESYYGSVKALRDLPKRLGLGRYIVKDDRTRRKLDPNDSRKYLDGTPAALDGTDGQCMWCWNGFYANIWHEGSRLIKAVTFDGPVGNDISIWIPAGGISWLGAGVIDRGDAPFTDKTKWKLCSVINNSEQFRGGGGTALDASKFSKAPADTTPQITMLGMPATNISTTDFGTYARRRDEGWEANWFVARFVVEFLFEVIMGTENSQEAFNANKDANGLYQGGFGAGVTDMPDWNNYNGVYPVIPTSVGLEAGDGVCLVPYNLPNTGGADGAYHTFNVPVFFGLVGAGYGNLWQFVRGVIMDAGEEKSLVYVSPSMYAAYDPNTVDDKIMVAECPRVSGWIMRKSYKGLCCMPTAIGGSHTLRYSDQFYTNAETSKGIRIRAADGRADLGTHAGASCAYAAYADSIAYAYCSAPLCYFEEDPIIPESQSIANNS